MAELMFALLSLAALFALAMNRAPLRVWAAAIALFTLALQTGLGSGHLHAPVFNFWALLGWLAAAGLFALTFPRIKRDYVVLPAYRASRHVAVHAVYPSRRFLAAKVRLFIDHLAGLYGERPKWDEGLDKILATARA